MFKVKPGQGDGSSQIPRLPKPCWEIISGRSTLHYSTLRAGIFQELLGIYFPELGIALIFGVKMQAVLCTNDPTKASTGTTVPSDWIRGRQWCRNCLCWLVGATNCSDAQLCYFPSLSKVRLLQKKLTLVVDGKCQNLIKILLFP